MTAAFPKSLRERATLYANAAHEVRLRLRTIGQMRGTGLPQMFVHENCQLQLRLSCECLAVACLAAQGDFATHKAFRERYEPPVIFKALEQIYPDFFPKPSLLSQDGRSWHFDGNAERPLALSRKRLEEIWRKSGSHLHRASAKRYITQKVKVDFGQVTNALEAFLSLLSSHAIILAPVKEDADSTILHVLMDRDTDAMRLYFLHVNQKDATIAVEQFDTRLEPEVF